jgi:hypothetical protein
MIVYLDDRPLTDTVRDLFTVDGALAPPVAVRAVQPLANAPGVLGTGVTVAPRTIAIGLDVYPASVVDRVTAMDAIYRRCSGLRLLRMDDSPTREQVVSLTDVRVEFLHIAVPRCYVELRFVAPDPTRFATESRAVALSTTPAAVPVGTMPSAPTLWLYGASPSVVNPIILVANASGDETHRLTLTGTLATDDALVLDCAAQTIVRYVAGVRQTGTDDGNAWLTSGQFPLLAPEDTIDGDGITVALTSTSGTPTGLLVYRQGF